MRQALKRLLLIIVLVFGMTVPVLAATDNRYEFKQKTVSVQIGKSKSLYIYQNDKKINPKSFQWSSSDPNIVSVSSNGRINAKTYGNVQIYAVKNKTTVCCNVYAYATTIHTNFKGYETKSINTAVSKRVRLKPVKHGNVAVYKSSDSKIATVSSDGSVIFKKTGAVTILCESYGRNRYTASIEFIVAPKVEDIIVPKEVTLNVGEEKSLDISTQPENAYIKSVAYKSSDESIAQVSETGYITANKSGIAKVSITVDSGEKIKKTIKVYVQDNEIDIADVPLIGSTKCIAHKGWNTDAPENSLPAFEMAGQKGVQYVETDIQETKDGVFVIFHDENLKRMCGVDANVSDLTYEEIKQYPIVNGTNASAYPDNIIPTLVQFLQCCNKYSMIPVIEIKTELNEASVVKLNQIIQMSDKNPVVISFCEEPLKLLRQMNRSVDIQWITRERISEEMLQECEKYQFDISARYKVTNRDIIREAHSRNIKVALWLFTDVAIAECYKNWGADYLTCENILV